MDAIRRVVNDKVGTIDKAVYSTVVTLNRAANAKVDDVSKHIKCLSRHNRKSSKC